MREDTLISSEHLACLAGPVVPMKTGGGGYREASCANRDVRCMKRLSTVLAQDAPGIVIKTMVGAEVEAVVWSARTCGTGQDS